MAYGRRSTHCSALQSSMIAHFLITTAVVAYGTRTRRPPSYRITAVRVYNLSGLDFSLSLPSFPLYYEYFVQDSSIRSDIPPPLPELPVQRGRPNFP